MNGEKENQNTYEYINAMVLIESSLILKRPRKDAARKNKQQKTCKQKIPTTYRKRIIDTVVLKFIDQVNTLL